ncbi:ester cyclase [Streptomyces sp. NBC_01304]|uniref:ester cyclase n=1 Tax=Streptomyces sp. NBC_01304 TaxID=2903818 RepID=UPI002E1122E8|nr:ester cyclase [Streptomyces sp. NBC_01304]
MPIVVQENPETHVNTDLWHRWVDLWNGNYDLAESVIAPKLETHLPAFGRPFELEPIDSPDSLVRWLEQWRSRFSLSLLATEFGPFVNDDHILARRKFTGVWQSGEPLGATARAGTEVEFAGVDVLRVEDGRVAEYWVGDNLIDMYVRLGAIRNPVRS